MGSYKLQSKRKQEANFNCEIMGKKEHWFKSLVFYPFRLVSSVLSALAMNDEGLSLKKILAAYSTYKAAQFSEAMLAPNNVLILVLMWLAYAGILVGIYSLGDISQAINAHKKGI